MAIKKYLRFLKLKQSFWSLADQGTVSLGNFFTNILLARNLPQADFGAYVIILSTIYFFNSIHTALITYPLSVKGASTDQDSLRSFTSSSFLLTGGLTLPLSLGVLAVSKAVNMIHLAPWVLIAMILWQTQEVTRRSLLAHLRHREALIGDGLSYLGQAGLVWFLSQRGLLSLEVTFGIISVTSLVGALVQIIQIGLKSVNIKQTWHLAESFWSLGRWTLMSNLLNLITNQAVPWTLAFFHGLKSAAALHAMSALLGVTHPVLFSISNLIVPAVAKARSEFGIQAAWKAALNYTIQGGALVLPYYTLLMLFPQFALRIFYGENSPYLDFEFALRFYALSYFINYISLVLGAFLNGLEESKANFYIQIVVTVAQIVLTLPLIAWFGLIGSIWGGIGILLVQIVASTFFIRKIYARHALV